MAKGDKRNKSDTTHFGLRMREEQRAGIEAAAAESGRSMNAEIIHRLEEYERVSQSYALFSDFPEVRHACQIVASIGDEIFSSDATKDRRKVLLSHAISSYYLPDEALLDLDHFVVSSAIQKVAEQNNPPLTVAARLMTHARHLIHELKCADQKLQAADQGGTDAFAAMGKSAAFRSLAMQSMDQAQDNLDRAGAKSEGLKSLLSQLREDLAALHPDE